MLIRTAATLLLALQLSQLGLPVLCPTTRSASTDACSEKMPQGGSAALVANESQGVTCPNAALCARLPAAVLTQGNTVSIPGVSRAQVPAALLLVTADPRAPLPPPPQA